MRLAMSVALIVNALWANIVLASVVECPEGANVPVPDFVETVDYADWYNRRAKSAQLRLRLAKTAPNAVVHIPAAEKLHTEVKQFLRKPEPWSADQPTDRKRWVRSVLDAENAFLRQELNPVPIGSFGRGSLFLFKFPGTSELRAIAEAHILRGWSTGELERGHFVEHLGRAIKVSNYFDGGIIFPQSNIARSIRPLVYSSILRALEANLISRTDLESLLEILSIGDARDWRCILQGWLEWEEASILSIVQALSHPMAGKATRIDPRKAERFVALFGIAPGDSRPLREQRNPNAGEMVATFGHYYDAVRQVIARPYSPLVWEEIEAMENTLIEQNDLAALLPPATPVLLRVALEMEVQRRANRLLLLAAAYRFRTGTWAPTLDSLGKTADEFRLNPLTGVDFSFSGQNGYREIRSECLGKGTAHRGHDQRCVVARLLFLPSDDSHVGR